jgi:hypothetical protein
LDTSSNWALSSPLGVSESLRTMKPQSTQNEKRRPRLPAAMGLKKPKVPSSASSMRSWVPVARRFNGTVRNHLSKLNSSSFSRRNPRSLKRWPIRLSLGKPSWQK